MHQFVRIGHHAFIGGASTVFGDVIPYGMARAIRGTLRGLNIVGMKRSGLPRAEIHAATRGLPDDLRPRAAGERKPRTRQRRVSGFAGGARRSSIS